MDSRCTARRVFFCGRIIFLSMEPLSPPAQEFLLREYDALRREVEMTIKDRSDYLRYAILSSGAIWAWLVGLPKGQGSPLVHAVSAWIPSLLTVLLCGEWNLLRRKIWGIARYIRNIEHHMQPPQGLGWETQLEDRTSKHKRSHVEVWERGIWGVLLIANAAGAWYLR